MTPLPAEKIAQTTKTSSVLLQVEAIPLSGRHMIEASAGTGKTFNIIRIYLRLLLERKLRVQNILVVTFTRAATEELRGRIGKQLRETLENWGNRKGTDPFFDHLESRIPKASAEILLHEALLNMDEAAIFTIHGFCKRVLSQHAFSSRLPFRLNMEADTSEVMLEVVRDAYRRWSMDAELYSLIASYWDAPEKFLAAFGRLLQQKVTIDCPDYQAMQNDYLTRKKQVYEQFQQQVEPYRAVMVTAHKDTEKRTEELDLLLNWLNINDLSLIPVLAKSCYNGSRLRSKVAIEQGIREMTIPVKALAEQAAELESQARWAKASAQVRDILPELIFQIDQAKYRQNMLDFNDLITKLKTALETDRNGHLTKALVTEYPVALVDEFQDTDSDQYAIFNKLYSHSNENALFMIGDPKQAIYSFRGGDVFTYLNARSKADYHWFMDTNWRSTDAMIMGCNRLFYGAGADSSPAGDSSSVFGFGIDYLPVNASKKIFDALSKDVGFRALQFVHFPVTLDTCIHKNKNNKSSKSEKQPTYKSSFRQVIARWCAAEIERLLSLPIQIPLSKEEGEDVTCRTLKEQDIAILVRDKTEAEVMQAALQERGYSAVYSSGRENVFASEESHYLFRTLTGILQLEEGRKRIAALSTPLLGLNAEQLYQLKEDELFADTWRETLSRLRRIWLKKGFLVMAISLLHDFLKPPKTRSERMLTNYLHLIELLQVASQRYRQPLELLIWFEQQRGNDFSQEVNQLRLESDANLIRIITQHGSKGLEYPIVFVPFSTRTKISKGTPDFVTYHDRENYQPRVRLAPDKEILGYASEEHGAEDIRLLYVAITRAVYRCYICTTQFEKSAFSPLGLTLGLLEEEDMFSCLQQLEQDHSSAINVLKVGDDRLHLLDAGQVGSMPNTGNVVDLQARRFQGCIERDWWISSFSMISQQAHAVSSYLPAALSIIGMGQPDRDFAPGPASSTIKSLPLRFAIKRGADTGNLLHGAFERVNFRQPDWAQALEIPLKKYPSLPTETLDNLPLWLDECLQATLREQEGKRLKLAELTAVQTLREIEFYFPVGKTTMTHLADFLTQYRASRSCQHKPVWLPDFHSLEGMMHGFIDLIFEWEGRYYLADYKSTWLGDSLHYYAKPELEESMEENFYDLQYLIYTVALHRHLAATVQDYQPESHLGGVFYLYLRGMQPSGDEGIFYTPVDALWIQKMDLLLKSEPEEAGE